MTARQIIEMKLAYFGITNSELARRLGWSPQLLNKRLNTGKFTVEEWERIGKRSAAKSTSSLHCRTAQKFKITKPPEHLRSGGLTLPNYLLSVSCFTL